MFGLGARHRVAALGFFGFFNVYAMRVNLSVAALSMSDELGWCKNDVNNTGASCAREGTILGSFFYGYIITQILGGYFATKYGGKHVFGLGVLCTSLLTILTPVAAKAGIGPMIAVRILEGFGEGVTFPAFHAILSRWVPYSERTKISTFVYAGAYIGTVFANPISSWLCAMSTKTDHPSPQSFYGWPSVFYVFGGLGCFWYVLWMSFFSSSPSTDKWITAEERSYIESNLSPPPEKGDGSDGSNIYEGDDELTAAHARRSESQNLLQNGSDGGAHEEMPPVPWKEIFSSSAVWAIIVAHTVANWGFYNLLTCLPQFVHNVLGKKISDLGFISSLPFLCMWFVANITGYFADYARGRGVRTVVVRKVCQCFGQAISAIAIVMVGHVNTDPTNSSAIYNVGHADNADTFGPDGMPEHGLSAVPEKSVTMAIVLLCISVGAAGFPLSGFNVNHLDIAPRYAGVLMGITNSFATIPGFLAPQVTDWLTTANPHTVAGAKLLKKQWQTVFYIAGVVYAFGIVFYAFFGSGKKQPWADGAQAMNARKRRYIN